jgi:hypothetical protein
MFACNRMAADLDRRERGFAASRRLTLHFMPCVRRTYLELAFEAQAVRAAAPAQRGTRVQGGRG